MADALASISGALHDSNAPLHTNGAHKSKSFLQKSVQDIKQVLSRDGPIVDLSILPALIDGLRNKDTGLDDRLLMLEKMLVIMSYLPDGNPVSQKLQNAAIDMFYKDLPHPPAYIVEPKSRTEVFNKRGGPLSDEEKANLKVAEENAAVKETNSPQKRFDVPYVKYAYRSADGSNYAPLVPEMGKAGMPYARTVPTLNVTPPSALPDAGLVFDTLLRKPKGTFTDHPGGISSLFFAFADLVIHNIFYTDHFDPMVNKTSSYLDLSPLYGINEEQVNKVRRKDGSGQLWNDVFADNRLRFMPPAVCALLVLFSRNHNYIAEKLLSINEFGTFVPVSQLDTEAKKLAQDDELFHRARLVNTGFFMQIILGDYVGAILGLARDRITWRLDPLAHYRSSDDHSVSPRGEGSLVSVEFNLMYRWHSTFSRDSEQWTEYMFSKHFFPGKNVDEITREDFKAAAHEYMIPDYNKVQEWSFDFGKYKRDANGRFNDADLAKLIQDATAARAGAFQARGVPECMRLIEVMGIEQARAWGTCSMNEFRKFMGLKPFDDFEDWNSNKEVAAAAAQLYGSIDNLELSVGLAAEEAKEAGPGAGLCPGYTISRAILSDAVCLTRGDRFLTTEFTPYNLTSWGYQDCILTDKDDGSYGGVLTKLLFRHLPAYYPPKSVFAHFPFLDPKFLKQEWLKDGEIDLIAKYSWDRPVLPKPNHEINEIVGETALDARLYTLTKGVKVEGKPLHFEDLSGFKATTQELIDFKSFTRAGPKNVKTKFVDVVKDVINLLPIHWISSEVIGLPLKTNLNPHGTWYEQDAYDDFASVAQYLDRNYEPEHDWVLRERASGCFKRMIEATENSLDSVHGGLTGSVRSYFRSWILSDESSAASKAFLSSVASSTDLDHKKLAIAIFTQLVPSAAQFSHVLSTVVDYYLDEDKKLQREQLIKAAKASNGDAVLEFVRVALMANPPIYRAVHTVTSDTFLKKDSGVKINAGDRVTINLSQTPVVTPAEAGKRRVVDPVYPGLGKQGLMEPTLFARIAPLVLSTVFSLKNARRISSQKTFESKWQKMYVDPRGRDAVFPCSLVVQYDV